MRRNFTILILMLVAACNSKPRTASGQETRVAAAGVFTQQYSRSPLADWNVRASAAGTNCDVLLVETSTILEDSMVNALHYGAGAYDVYGGGIQRFSNERSFRGVAYRDATGHIWTFGDVTVHEAASLKRCG